MSKRNNSVSSHFWRSFNLIWKGGGNNTYNTKRGGVPCHLRLFSPLTCALWNAYIYNGRVQGVQWIGRVQGVPIYNGMRWSAHRLCNLLCLSNEKRCKQTNTLYTSEGRQRAISHSMFPSTPHIVFQQSSATTVSVIHATTFESSGNYYIFSNAKFSALNL